MTAPAIAMPSPAFPFRLAGKPRARRGGFVLFSDATTFRTLGRMRHLVRRALHDRAFVWWVRDVMATAAPAAIAARNFGALARAIRDYVGAHIRFVPDPRGVENLTPPSEHARLLKETPAAVLLGDCDDAATLSAAMGMALGMDATFSVRAFRRPDNPYQHVVTTLLPRGAPAVECDTTASAQKLPPVPTREKTVRV